MLLSLLLSLSNLVCGFVKDAVTQEPLPFVTVQVEGLVYKTDSLGHLCFPATVFPVTVRLQQIGYENAEFTFSDSSFTFLLKPKTLSTEEVVITSVRAEDRMPITQKTLRKEDIQNGYTGQEMPVLLSRTPSITWYSDGGHFTGYSYFRLRGIDQTRINLTLNGVPLNEPEDQGAYFSNYPDFLNSVQSIQVQRGVGTSTNGTTSFGGSVNLESPNLRDSAHVQLQTSYGSFDTYRISPSFHSGVLKNKFAFYGRYSLAGTSGYREHSGNQGHSFFMSGGYFAKRGLLKLTAFSGNSKSDMAYLAVSKQDIDQNPRTNYLSKDETDDFSQQMAQLQYTHFLGKKTTLVATGYYTRLGGAYKILFTPDLYAYAVKSDFYGGMINVNAELGKLKLFSGIHVNGYQRSHFMRLEPKVSENLYLNTGYKQEASAFVKATYEVGKFLLFGDLQGRTVHFQYQGDASLNQTVAPINWTFLNPKGGITYRFTDYLSSYVSIGKTSREPTRNDLFAGYDNVDSSNYSQVGDLKKVKPETVTDYEVGMTYRRPQVNIQANLFDMEFRNEIAAIGQLSYIGLPLRKNVDRSSRRGLELDVDVRFLKRWRWTGSMTLSQNTIKEYRTEYDSVTYRNVQPLLTPSLLFQNSLGCTLGVFYLEANGRYMGKSYLDNTQNENFVTPSSFVLNASLAIKPWKYLSIQLMVNNLTDTRYFTSGYVQNAQSYYFAMAGRNYFFTLRFDF